MAQDIIYNKKTYKSVPAIEIPTTTGGKASFIDTSDGTATAGDIAKDKIAYVGGEKIVGTLINSGSGGNDDAIVWHKLKN